MGTFMQNNLSLQINMEQILNVLSASLYKGNVLNVATRELLQNSFDAVKRKDDAKIQVDFDQRTLIFKDNGIGMSTDTVRNVFFTVGGTAKEGLSVEERSGGFGIAKVQFFMAAEYIEVESVRDGIKTTAKATQYELLSGAGHIMAESTTEENGTKVLLCFPDKIMDNGVEKYLSYYSWDVSNVLKKRLIGYDNIRISYNDTEIEHDKKYDSTITERYDWGDVEISFEPKLDSSGYLYADVHCAGLFQFKQNWYIGNDLGMNCRINVKPKFAAGDNKYAFANSRDNFSGYAAKDIESIKDAFKKLALCIRGEQIQQAYASQKPLQYMSVTASIAAAKAQEVSNRKPLDFTKLLNNVDSLDAFLKLLDNIIERQSAEAKAAAEAKEEGKEQCLRLINKTDLIFDKHQEVFSKIASVVYDVCYTPEIRSSFRKSVSISGVIVEKGIRGACLTLDGITGIYVNPIGIFHNERHFANVMTECLIHELAHAEDYRCDTSYHEASFFEAEHRIRNKFFAYDLYETVYSKFASIYSQYKNILNV